MLFWYTTILDRYAAIADRCDMARKQHCLLHHQKPDVMHGQSHAVEACGQYLKSARNCLKVQLETTI